MKKTFLLIATTGLIILSSCRKNYTCDCTLDGNTDVLPIPDSKADDAEDLCNAWKSEYALGGGTCTLKVK